MHIFGAFRFMVFLGTWMVGAFSIPVALVCAYYSQLIPLYILITYYVFRAIFPAKNWPFFVKMMCLNDHPYFNSSKIIFDKEAKPPEKNSKTLLSVVPHGILTIGFNSINSSNEFREQGFYWIVADILSKTAFISDIVKWANMWGATPSIVTGLMKQGYNIGLLPGGFQEATLYQYAKHRLYIKNRKGFIKYSLQYGYCIQPAYCFGEEFTYWQVETTAGSYMDKFRLWLNKYNIPATCFTGTFLFMPNSDLDMLVVIGEPIALPHIPHPTPEDVEKYHQLYITKIRELFDKYKYSVNVNKYKEMQNIPLDSTKQPTIELELF